MKVLALDPGERVGWAIGTITKRVEGVLIRHEMTVEDHGISYLKDCYLAVDDALVDGRYDVVVMEGFKLTQRGAKTSIGSTMQTVQFIGMVRGSCWRHGVPLRMQWPADKSSARRSLKIDHPAAAAMRERLEKITGAHDDRHDEDALIHLWHHFFTEYV